MNISTDIGKIYCRYNEETDNFDMIRLSKISTDEDSGKKTYTFTHLDENFHMIHEDSVEKSSEEYDEIKKELVLLRSEGILALTNVVSISNEARDIKDVLAIYFPNNKNTGIPDVEQPYIVARQGIDNVFAEMAGVSMVGMSVSLDSIPAGYVLTDFMANDSVLGSNLCHVYKSDTEKDLAKLLENDQANNILSDLFEHALNYKKNTIDGYELPENDKSIDGYCKDLETFLVESGFMLDLYDTMGIIPLDFVCEEGKALSDTDKVYVSAMLGGIHINKAVPMKFDYTVNFENVSMRYFLAIDKNDILWIIPYTLSGNEVDADSIYKLTEDATTQLQERLRRVVRAYDGNSEA